MGFFTSYDLRGWGPDGRFLSASEKEEIQNFVFDEGVEDCGCSHSDRDEHIMSFCDTSFHAYDDVTNVLRDYAGLHPDFLLELEYSSEAEDHQLIRFKGDDAEIKDRVEFFPPFSRLARREDDNSLPILEFQMNDKSIMVLVDRAMSTEGLDAIEDSVMSYCDNSAPNPKPEQLIHDVLSAANVSYWFLKPDRTFLV